MPLVVKDRVQETTTTTGTGTVTLGGAVSGYQSFSAIGNGNTTYYTIHGGTEWEVGIGTYTSSGTTLSRTTVLASSNSGSLVNFSAGTKNVFVTYPSFKTNPTQVSTTPPTNPMPGEVWLNSEDGQTYVYYVDTDSAQWISAASGVSGPNTVTTSTTTNITGILQGNGSVVSGVTSTTGSGNLVFATSPTLVTPVLGTPTSGALTNCTADGTNAVGYRNVPISGSAKSSSYSLTTADVGKYIEVTTGGSITVPNSTFATGDVLSIFNNTSGAITLTMSITTAYIGGTDSDKATISLATRGVATILFISGTLCVVSGNVS